MRSGFRYRASKAFGWLQLGLGALLLFLDLQILLSLLSKRSEDASVAVVTILGYALVGGVLAVSGSIILQWEPAGSASREADLKDGVEYQTLCQGVGHDGSYAVLQYLDGHWYRTIFVKIGQGLQLPPKFILRSEQQPAKTIFHYDSR